MKKVLLMLTCVLSLSSCGTLFTPSKQPITFMGMPETRIYDNGKKLGEITSRLQDELVKLELNGSAATITCKNSKFDIIGISASEFPRVEEEIVEEDSIEIETKPFTKAIRQVVSAAAGYETNNLLSGVVCEVNKNILEMAATDGNRLARVREVVKNTRDFSKFNNWISSLFLTESCNSF